jgi:hypothetical protein
MAEWFRERFNTKVIQEREVVGNRVIKKIKIMKVEKKRILWKM